MDLISRESAKAEMDKLMEIHFDRTVVLGKAKDKIESLPSAFEGMTNGEVIKALFPNMTIVHKSSNGVLTVVESLDSPYPHEFYSEWWNSPYQKGGEA